MITGPMTPTSSTRRPPRRRRKARTPLSPAEAASGEAAPGESLQVQERLLDQLAQGAKLCQDVERQLRQYPAPELQTIIQLHRSLVLKLSVEAQADPDLFKLVSTLMKPVMDWARLEEKRRDRELAERRYRDQAAAQKAAADKARPDRGEALRPETLERIERELHLF